MKTDWDRFYQLHYYLVLFVMVLAIGDLVLINWLTDNGPFGLESKFMFSIVIPEAVLCTMAPIEEYKFQKL